MHKDQERLKAVFLPQLMDRILAETPEAERDCTVLNRMLIQGPDPLFLMEADPLLFATLCTRLSVPAEKAREAVESAHWMGPATLLGDGTGLHPDLFQLGTVEARIEAVWLVLAAVSDCTEDTYGDDVSMLERVRRAFSAVSKLRSVLELDHLTTVEAFAKKSLKEFIETTNFVIDPATGIPHATEDHAFYVLYKQGFSCVAVHTPKMVFYGTPPEHTLAGEGVAVDKEISPHFGIVFGEHRLPE